MKLLRLDKNEGPPPSPALLAQWSALGAEELQRYAVPDELERDLARRFGLEPEQVLVTCGGDDGLERFAQSYLGPDRALVHTVPTFGVLLQRAAEVGAGRRPVAWFDGPLPTSELLAALDDAAALYVVGPNNPTGVAPDRAAWEALLDGVGDKPLLADLAYVEFDDEDPSAWLVERGALVLRTFSKAFGLAGLRVGYLLGPAARLAPLRARRAMYPVAAPSLAIARAALALADGEPNAYVEAVRAERGELAARLRACGLRVPETRANFAYGLGAGAPRLAERLRELGIWTRSFAPGEGVEEPGLRITAPGNAADFERTCRALEDCRAR
ncbi:MAG: aminotransferase class I/II-fold pyridoxal phosphate-dependent enzyme [Planctomycetota bacterium]